MALTLLIDFGSTYTKITAVDLEKGEVVGRSQEPSTVATDMTIGFQRAYDKLLRQVGTSELKIEKKLACSSAAGGLRMVAIGLIPRLTVEAAKQAALSSGAKVVGVYSYELTSGEQQQIEELSPDIILLAGGTNGGNRDVILHNARCLASSKLACPIVVAGNKTVAEEIESILRASEKYVRRADNVMPEVGELNVESSRSVIREIFISRIVQGKGLDKAQNMTGGILMPTPMAVLKGATLLAEGTAEESGLGDLIVIDVGGATTDVDSICEGRPLQPGVILKSLPEAYAKRTVEGDLGIRYNAPLLLELAGKKRVTESMITHDEALAQRIDLERAVKYLAEHIDAIPQTEDDLLIDTALACTAAAIATERHCGTIEAVHTPASTVYVQRGKDLTDVKYIIGTGGIFAYGQGARQILEAVKYDKKNPFSLRPKAPELLIDKLYVLYAGGLLSEVAPAKALRIMKSSLKKV